MRYVQATPLVVGDIMFVTLPPNEVYALDARTGKQLWSYTGPEPQNLRVTGNGGASNRGVAILGNTVFFVQPTLTWLRLTHKLVGSSGM